MLCDRHIVNQPRESAVMLMGGWKNHPCTVWTWESLQNYEWHITHAIALCDEYTYRYGKEHASLEPIEYCKLHLPDLPDSGLTPFVLATKGIGGETVEAYRKYYLKYKMSFATWKHRQRPYWIEQQATSSFGLEN